jgi:hypothetical protein
MTIAGVTEIKMCGSGCSECWCKAKSSAFELVFYLTLMKIENSFVLGLDLAIDLAR